MSHPLHASLLALVLAGAGLAAQATPAETEARYRSERATCLSGQSSQDRTTCLKEAGAARAEARRAPPTLPGASEPDYRRNALARCLRQPSAEQADCRRRVQGEGSRQGSVAEGAVLYELVTRTVAAPTPAASAP